MAAAIFLGAFWFLSQTPQDTRPLFYLGGGPQGSTAQNIAQEIVALLNKEMPAIRFKVKQSAGSADNLRGIEAEKLHLALASAEDSYFHMKTLAEQNKQQHSKAVMLVRLFGDYAHLLVSRSNPVQTPAQLIGRRVAIGSSGSDSAIIARRYFQALGIWRQITPIYVGYELALNELVNGTVEAVWLMSGIPSEAVRQTNGKHPLRCLNVWNGIPTSDPGKTFYEAYPFYEISMFPPQTYSGQTERIFSIGIASLLVASETLSDEFIFKILDCLYRPENLQKIREKYPAAQEIRLSRTLTPFSLPMHSGAVKFLRERL